MRTQSVKTKKLVTAAVLSVLIIVLQFLSYIIQTGSVSISLVLVPVVLGSVMLDSKYGALLGFVFGIVTLVACIIGLDVGGAVLFNSHPVLTSLLCILKGTLAGFLSGIVYKLVSKRNETVGVIAAAVVCPVVNTGIFCTFMALFYKEILSTWANGADIIAYVFTGLIGINFVLELIINVTVCPILSKSLGLTKKGN